ncbi:hypothetical protein HPB52_018797 [Rhipicephalus sanguineus]|uniref:CS domain-containing protein n=1 Tax=Rhipicephalus sanguineus TaxID=34632 RepID=A0A9D4PN96_RHISA|nr:hypothetical protein HPB52_018797 [Rhipicephalus sanguineus]
MADGQPTAYHAQQIPQPSSSGEERGEETISICVEVVLTNVQNSVMRLGASVLRSCSGCIHETSSKHWATWFWYPCGKIRIAEGIHTEEGYLICNVSTSNSKIEYGRVRQSLEQDIAELRALEASAQRTRVQQIMSIEVRKLETELIRERERQGPAAAPGAEAKHSASQQSRNTPFTTKITNYAWDQSDKFVKLYVTLPGVHELPAESVKSAFGTRRLELEVNGLAGRNHQLLITTLMNDIVPDSSYHKVKTDMVAVFLRKTSSDKWSDISGLDKKAKEPK